jgi:hypothetical protein
LLTTLRDVLKATFVIAEVHDKSPVSYVVAWITSHDSSFVCGDRFFPFHNLISEDFEAFSSFLFLPYGIPV